MPDYEEKLTMEDLFGEAVRIQVKMSGGYATYDKNHSTGVPFNTMVIQEGMTHLNPINNHTNHSSIHSNSEQCLWRIYPSVFNSQYTFRNTTNEDIDYAFALLVIRCEQFSR